MKPSERRQAILRKLIRRGSAKVPDLAQEFGVSERTIYRDVTDLSFSAPIYTKAGRYLGGIYMEPTNPDKSFYVTETEAKVLLKVYDCITQKNIDALNEQDLTVFQQITELYILPKIRRRCF